jgi:hypothetical protein
MSFEKADYTGKKDASGRKISLKKVVSMNRGPEPGGLIAWESAIPQIGQPYRVHLYGGLTLKTGALQEIQEIKAGFIIQTSNTVYKIEYL